MTKEEKLNSWIRMAFVGSLTLGLAPFFPEPHVWGKIRWILGGAVGMQPLDWFDFFMHGGPWFLLIGLLGYKGFQMMQARK